MLQLFGKIMGMHVLGDKYNIPGLKDCCFSYILKVFKGNIWLRHWEQEFSIWEIIYENSRIPDPVRQVLEERICDVLCYAPTLPLEKVGFCQFLDKSPEIAPALLKRTLLSHAAKDAKCSVNPFRTDKHKESWRLGRIFWVNEPQK